MSAGSTVAIQFDLCSLRARQHSIENMLYWIQILYESDRVSNMLLFSGFPSLIYGADYYTGKERVAVE